MSLEISDVSQVDVVNDLLMLKSHCGEKNDLSSRYTGYTQANVGTARSPYQFTSVEEAYNTTSDFQSTTSMEGTGKQLFEVE